MPISPDNEKNIKRQNDEMTMKELLNKMANASDTDREYFRTIILGISSEKFFDPDYDI